MVEKNLEKERSSFGELLLTQIGLISAARPSFLPFTQQIASYLAEKVLPPRTVDAGLPITHYLNENNKDLEYSLTLPNGSLRNLIPQKRKDRHILEFAETRIPGTYQLSDPEKDHCQVCGSPIRFRINPGKSFRRQDFGCRQCSCRWHIRINGTEGKGWASYLTMDSRRKFGRETWQILLAIVLALVLVEIILLKRFGRIAR